MRSEVSAWLKHRNTRGAPSTGFTDDARIKTPQTLPGNYGCYGILSGDGGLDRSW
jgi:hypothetical protein